MSRLSRDIITNDHSHPIALHVAYIDAGTDDCVRACKVRRDDLDLPVHPGVIPVVGATYESKASERPKQWASVAVTYPQ